MRKKKQKNNVRKFIKKPELNIGFYIFVVILIYIIGSVVIYLLSEQTVIYEVNAGSLTTNISYTGFIIRDEELIESNYSGSVNYFLKSKERVNVTSTVYSVDETGRVSDIINESLTDSMSQADLSIIRDSLTEYKISYDPMSFENIYSTQQSVLDRIYEFKVDNIMDNLDAYIESTNDAEFFHKENALKTGVVVYTIDGYEKYSESDLTPELFETSDYNSTNLQTASIINQGDTAYKLISDDNWYIYVALNDEQLVDLADSSTVDLTFVDSELSCTSDFSIITVDGNSYGKISLDKYMINYTDSRFIQITIGNISKQGLKIPHSSVFQKSFYTIPIDFINNDNNFIVEYYDSDGNIHSKSITPTIYDKTDAYYFVSKDEFNSGDIIRKINSDDSYIVGTIDELYGVFSVNRGYAIFRKVDIIDENSEYYIVEKGNTTYGLSIYDHIVLDYNTINENEIVN